MPRGGGWFGLAGGGGTFATATASLTSRRDLSAEAPWDTAAALTDAGGSRLLLMVEGFGDRRATLEQIDALAAQHRDGQS